MATRLLMAPCCHDTIDLDPPDTEYLMIKCLIETKVPPQHTGNSMGVRDDGQPRDPYVKTIESEQPYHVVCLKAGRGLKNGVTFDMITVPGPLGTRRYTTRKEMD